MNHELAVVICALGVGSMVILFMGAIDALRHSVKRVTFTIEPKALGLVTYILFEIVILLLLGCLCAGVVMGFTPKEGW